MPGPKEDTASTLLGAEGTLQKRGQRDCRAEAGEGDCEIRVFWTGLGGCTSEPIPMVASCTRPAKDWLTNIFSWKGGGRLARPCPSLGDYWQLMVGQRKSVTFFRDVTAEELPRLQETRSHPCSCLWCCLNPWVTDTPVTSKQAKSLLGRRRVSVWGGIGGEKGQ